MRMFKKNYLPLHKNIKFLTYSMFLQLQHKFRPILLPFIKTLLMMIFLFRNKLKRSLYRQPQNFIKEGNLQRQKLITNSFNQKKIMSTTNQGHQYLQKWEFRKSLLLMSVSKLPISQLFMTQLFFRLRQLLISNSLQKMT